MSRSFKHRRAARSSTAAFRLPPSAIPRRGLTLIEMLMATAITLLMMAAVVNLFANLSGSIRNRRAVIELSSQLRQVRQRLARDLAGCTVPLRPAGLVPWQRTAEAVGYFEILEGNRSDANPSQLINGVNDPADGDLELDYGTTLVPGSQMADAENGQMSDGRALGDYDDILALTVRSDSDPFIAQVPGIGKVESSLAEVLWYATENPADNPDTTADERIERILDDPTTTDVDESETGDGPIREPGMRTVYRRVLLIAPWLGPWGPGDRPWHISVHRDQQTNLWVANTLADLTRREYRFAHELDYTFSDFDFPHEIDFNDLPYMQLYAPEFIVLNDALAFDVLVYDPGAPLYQITTLAGGTPQPDDPVVDPGDPAWARVFNGTVATFTGPPNNTPQPVGFGAYVDLGWNDAAAYLAAGEPQPLFQFEHRVGWHPARGADPTLVNPNPVDPVTTNARNPYRGMPATYDTWTWHYENDGYDQDDDADDVNKTNDNNNDQNYLTGLVDEGTNGRDDPYPIPGSSTPQYVNGVDDPLERETWPPYNSPLRAVRVLFRTYERDSRQIREASVTHSFVP